MKSILKTAHDYLMSKTAQGAGSTFNENFSVSSPLPRRRPTRPNRDGSWQSSPAKPGNYAHDRVSTSTYDQYQSLIEGGHRSPKKKQTSVPSPQLAQMNKEGSIYTTKKGDLKSMNSILETAHAYLMEKQAQYQPAQYDKAEYVFMKYAQPEHLKRWVNPPTVKKQINAGEIPSPVTLPKLPPYKSIFGPKYNVNASQNSANTYRAEANNPDLRKRFGMFEERAKRSLLDKARASEDSVSKYYSEGR